MVVAELLAAEGYKVSARTLQRLTSERRRATQAATVASVRFETAPGVQMQIDFGQKLVSIGGTLVRVSLPVAVLSYSRRLFVKPFLARAPGRLARDSSAYRSTLTHSLTPLTPLTPTRRTRCTLAA